MEISIQGTNRGMISELYTRYSFSFDAKYEEGRHQICVEDEKKYGVFKGIAHVELICENHMVLHIVPNEEDFDTVYHSLKYPLKYLSLGRYEDLLDVERVDVVNLSPMEKDMTSPRDIYIPVDYLLDIQDSMTIYRLSREYEIDKRGMRKWNSERGKVQVFYYPKGIISPEFSEEGKLMVDDFEESVSVVALV